MARKPSSSARPRPGPKVSRGRPPGRTTTLRVIGGDLRSRLLEYDGDLHTRPMKDRVREAVFNLIGPAIKHKFAIDLFAGTGALAIEALSRGASEAIMLERRFPAAEVIGRNLKSLGLADRAQVFTTDTFYWLERATLPKSRPWVVFCSPPYELYQSQSEDLLRMLQRLQEEAPANSLLVVEADARFDMSSLPLPEQWDVRVYPPAVVGILVVAERVPG